MKRLLGIILVAAGCGAAGADEGIDWRTDLKKAGAEARKSGRPMLVVFR